MTTFARYLLYSDEKPDAIYCINLVRKHTASNSRFVSLFFIFLFFWLDSGWWTGLRFVYLHVALTKKKKALNFCASWKWKITHKKKHFQASNFIIRLFVPHVPRPNALNLQHCCAAAGNFGACLQSGEPIGFINRLSGASRSFPFFCCCNKTGFSSTFNIMTQMYSGCIWSFLNSSVSLSIHPSIHLPFIHVSIHPSMCLCIRHPSSIHTDIDLFIHLHLSIYPFIPPICIHPYSSAIHVSIHPPSSHTYFYLSIHPFDLYPSMHVAYPSMYLWSIPPSIHLSLCIYVPQRIHGKSPIATCSPCQYLQQMRCFLTTPFRTTLLGEKKRDPRKAFTHGHERKDSTPKKAQDLSSPGRSVACVCHCMCNNSAW